MAVEARYFFDGQTQSARFADFVPQEMKYVALIATCPSEGRYGYPVKQKRQTALIGRRHEKCSAFWVAGGMRRYSVMTN